VKGQVKCEEIGILARRYGPWSVGPRRHAPTVPRGLLSVKGVASRLAGDPPAGEEPQAAFGPPERTPPMVKI